MVSNASKLHASQTAQKPSSPYRNLPLDTASTRIIGALHQYQGMVLLTGEAGVGKSYLLQRCEAEAGEMLFVTLSNPHLDFPDIINYLCAKLDLSTLSSNAEVQIQVLLEALALSALERQIIVLVIDDAHLLHSDVIARLHNFVATPALPSECLQIVLSGQPELEGKLAQAGVLGKIATRCRLGSLSAVEASSFIYHWFANSAENYGKLIPTPPVIESIAQYAHGIPRTIALLCDAMLLTASLGNTGELTPELVDDAARSCFLTKTASTDPHPPAPFIVAHDPLSLGFPDLGLGFDFDLEETVKTDQVSSDWSLLNAALPAEVPPAALAAELAIADHQPQLRSLSAAASWFAELLTDVECKQERKETQIRALMQHFLNHYQHLLHNHSASLQPSALEQRLASLHASAQPLLLSVAAPVTAVLEGTLHVLLLNPSWWMYREIRLRLRSADLQLADDGQSAPLRLLDGHDAWVLSFPFRRLHQEALALWLELELCDHRGAWSAYANQQEMRLDVPAPHAEQWAAPSVIGGDAFWPSEQGEDLWQYTLPLEMEAYAEQTQHLRTQHPQTLHRGTPLTRALLLPLNPKQAPARIELVSRPLMIFGRQSAVGGTGFGDFTLGLVPKYGQISRLHCAVCALGDQLVLLAASDQGYTYTGCNGERLAAGQWRALEHGAVLDICDLYRLHLSLAWDNEREESAWNPQEARERFGHYLLDLVEVLHQRDQQADSHALRAHIRNRYLHLLHMQERVSELNGVGTSGTLLYARFLRDDVAAQQIAHYYVPKWLPIGSAAEDGLRLRAPDVQAHHAELMFRDGCYWLQNLGAPASVQVGCHGLATNEVLALAVGDTLAIGTVRLRFEGF